MPRRIWWSSGCGRIELRLSKQEAASASHPGECDADVLALSKVPAIARQLAKLDAETLRAVLKEFGAWNAEELADHEQNLQRVLWCAACDVDEGRFDD